MKKVYKQGQALIEEIHATKVPQGMLAFWNLGQSGLLVKNPNQTTLVIDPYLTQAIEEKDPKTEFIRAFDPVLDPEDLRGIDAVLITHQHDDHLDPFTLERLARVSPETSFYIPSPHVKLAKSQCPSLEKVIPVKAGKEEQIKEFSIRPIASAHAEYEQDEDQDHFYLGYVLFYEGISLYHSGDTLITDELCRELQSIQPDVAFLPINGGDYFRLTRNIIPNMSFREAVDFAALINADLLVAIHYDMFPNNRENPSYFVDYLLSHYPSQKFHMPAPGERFLYMK